MELSDPLTSPKRSKSSSKVRTHWWMERKADVGEGRFILTRNRSAGVFRHLKCLERGCFHVQPGRTLDCQMFGVDAEDAEALFLDFAPTGQPYASPGQRPELWRDQDYKAPTGAVLAGFGESFLGPPRGGLCRNLRNETPGDAGGYLRAAPLGRRKAQKPTTHLPCQHQAFGSPRLSQVHRQNLLLMTEY